MCFFPVLIVLCSFFDWHHFPWQTIRSGNTIFSIEQDSKQCDGRWRSIKQGKYPKPNRISVLNLHKYIILCVNKMLTRFLSNCYWFRKSLYSLNIDENITTVVVLCLLRCSTTPPQNFVTLFCTQLILHASHYWPTNPWFPIISHPHICCWKTLSYPPKRSQIGSLNSKLNLLFNEPTHARFGGQEDTLHKTPLQSSPPCKKKKNGLTKDNPGRTPRRHEAGTGEAFQPSMTYRLGPPMVL